MSRVYDIISNTAISIGVCLVIVGVCVTFYYAGCCRRPAAGIPFLLGGFACAVIAWFAADAAERRAGRP